MKHVNSQGSSRPALTVKTLLGGAAIAALMGLSFNAQAQTCVVSNWLGGAVGVTDANADSPLGGNSRYAGPCSLNVPGGAAGYVIDDTPSAEGTYIARFYTFLDDAGAGQYIIYEADDGAAAQIQVWYNFPAAGDLTLRVFDSGAVANDVTFNSVPAGWTSVEFVWEAAASANILFSVNGAADQSVSIDTSGITIANALLGNVNGAGAGTDSLQFDAFDSRRISRPGRLCRGDTDESIDIGFADLNAVGQEILSGGTNLAGGQPDYDENGSVGFGDLNDIFFNHIQIANSVCP